MNAKRLAELDRHPERATVGELLLCAGFTFAALGLLAGLAVCAIIRVMQ